jgi:ADP-ribose pyrophosphatase
MTLDESCLESEQTYSGYLLKVFRDKVVLPDGAIATREYVRHGGACVIIAEVRPGVLILSGSSAIRSGRYFWNFPLEKIDAGDTLLGCAQRELREETGYSAADWQHLGVMHPCIGYSSEKIDIFLARNLTPGEQELDAGEFLEVFELSLEDAEDAVLRRPYHRRQNYRVFVLGAAISAAVTPLWVYRKGDVTQLLQRLSGCSVTHRTSQEETHHAWS